MFEAVYLDDDFDGDDDVVVGELEDGIGIVEEDVGVDDVVLAHGGITITGGMAGGAWGWAGRLRGG